jgi:hypothetical protein
MNRLNPKNFAAMSLLLIAAYITGFCCKKASFAIPKDKFKEQPTNINSSDRGVDYRDLYYWHLASDSAKYTALLHRMDKAEFVTARKTLLILLKSDLSSISLVTNYLWSSEQEKAIKYAKEYVDQNDSK